MNVRTTVVAGFAAVAAFALTGVVAATPSTGQESQTLIFDIENPGNANLTFNLFDDMGGTRQLQMVEIFMNVTLGAQVTATNDTQQDANFFAVNLSGNAQVTFGGVNAISLLSVTESVPAEDLPIGPGQLYDFGFVSDSDSSDGSTMSNLNTYVGVGTIDALVNVTGGFSVSGVSNSTLVVEDFGAVGDVTIVYHYKLLPAPGALALLGLAGLVGTRRRR